MFFIKSFHSSMCKSKNRAAFRRTKRFPPKEVAAGFEQEGSSGVPVGLGGGGMTSGRWSSFADFFFGGGVKG